MHDHGTLQGNRAAVDAYSKGHLDEFGGYQLAAGPRSVIRVAFTGHVAEHGRALAGLVPFPDRIEVVLAHHTLRELAAIHDQLSVELTRPDRQGAFRYVGEGWQTVTIGLAPGREDLALGYAERFGDAVSIDLGGHPYVPAGCGPAPEPRRCGELTGSDPATAGIELTVVADTPTIAPFENGHARLIVHNIGSKRFAIDSGIPVVGSLVIPGTTRVVGTYAGAVGGVGGGVDLSPGQRGEVEVLFGASRCDGQPGSALPPGTYGLRVVLQPEGFLHEPRLLSGQATVTIRR